MAEHLESDPPLWIQNLDKRGRPIQGELLEAAQRDWKRVLSYARRHRQDAAFAAEVFETVVHSLSSALRRHPHPDRSIKNLDNYLFWAFARRLNRLLAREPAVEYMGSFDDLQSLKGTHDADWVSRVHNELLVKELQSYMSARVRHVFFLRESGYSWGEISRKLGIKADNLWFQFRYGIGKARKRILRTGHRGWKTTS